MTVSKVTIEKHEKGIGWFKITLVSMTNFVGETKIELLMRAETLRSIREGADRALKNKPALPKIDLFRKED